MTTSATTAPSRVAVLLLVALAVGWVSMYAMHVGVGDGAAASGMTMSVSAKAGDPPGGDSATVTASAAVQPGSSPISTVRTPASRCESLDSQGTVPRGGSDLAPAPAATVAGREPPLLRRVVPTPGGAVRSLPPPSLDLLSISRT